MGGGWVWGARGGLEVQVVVCAGLQVVVAPAETLKAKNMIR
jgi:hypothetical protein